MSILYVQLIGPLNHFRGLFVGGGHQQTHRIFGVRSMNILSSYNLQNDYHELYSSASNASIWSGLLYAW